MKPDSVPAIFAQEKDIKEMKAKVEELRLSRGQDWLHEWPGIVQSQTLGDPSKADAEGDAKGDSKGGAENDSQGDISMKRLRL